MATPTGKKRRSGGTGNLDSTKPTSQILKESDLKKEVQEFLEKKPKRTVKYSPLELAIITGLVAQGAIPLRELKNQLKTIKEHLEDD